MVAGMRLIQKKCQLYFENNNALCLEIAALSFTLISRVFEKIEKEKEQLISRAGLPGKH